MQNDTSKHKPIAVVGVSALFPGSQNANGFWGDILAGTDMVKEIPKSHWLIEDYYDQDQSAKDKTYGRRGAFLGPYGHAVAPIELQKRLNSFGQDHKRTYAFARLRAVLQRSLVKARLKACLRAHAHASQALRLLFN